MSDVLLLSDSHAVSDLNVFLQRATRLAPDAVRISASNGTMTITVPVMVPRGILDSSPTVLGMRVMQEHSSVGVDRTVDVRGITERLARPAQLTEEGRVILRLPDAEQHVGWAGTAVPRGGWVRESTLTAAAVAEVAAEGVARVAEALPDNPGEALVTRVRAEVWGTADARLNGILAATAFAADSLGFVSTPDEELGVFRADRWVRLSSRTGHVLVREGRGL